MKKLILILIITIGCKKQSTCEKWDVEEVCQAKSSYVVCHDPTFLTITVCNGDAYEGKHEVLDDNSDRTDTRIYLHKQ